MMHTSSTDGAQPGTKPRRRKIRMVVAPESGMTVEWLSGLPETCWIQLRMDTLRQIVADARTDATVDALLGDGVD